MAACGRGFTAAVTEDDELLCLGRKRARPAQTCRRRPGSPGSTVISVCIGCPWGRTSAWARALRQGERGRDDCSKCYDDDGGGAGEACGGSMRVEGSWGAEKGAVAGDNGADGERGDLRPGDKAAQRVERPL
jgi:hypothetical protein